MNSFFFLVAFVNVIAVLFFAALYIKRIKIDNSRKAARKFEAQPFANPYLTL